jgi:hypothetical protein
MKLYQPVLFVGLGGTGCLIGAELERRLREEICGPDGSEYRRLREGANLLRYQLPSCLQFVYADVNQADLDRLPSRVVPGVQHQPAVQATAHYVRDLVPRVDTYPEVARNLRLSAGRVVEGWLPPPAGEPRVAPLQRGAGQLPTVGRAALFETFRGGVGPAVRDLRRAVGSLSTSGEDLYRLGGRTSKPKAVDVFVAFSVAGGTGAGIFYDYLHLIGDLFEQTELRAKIYPLVLMPSAFPQGLGGGRPAELNAGRALLDLFRLVDQQNGGDADLLLRGRAEQGAIDPEDIAVHYPSDGRIALRPATVQTGFLFSRPVGAEREDLHRSVVSLILSLIGTELSPSDAAGAETHQSFTDSFINASIERQIPAENGIGNRGVSTALVASLTVPADDLADIVAGRLLRAAVDELSSPLRGAERNRGQIEEFLNVAGIHDVFTRRPVDFAEPSPATGARNIAAALTDRLESMRAGLGELQGRLTRVIPDMVATFEPRAAVQQMLGQYDVFRLQRVVFGHPELNDEVDRTGALGLMQRRRAAPPPPEGFGITPPQVPPIHDRFFGLVKAKWNDRTPIATREDQNIWYRWRSNVLWAEQWAVYAPRWRRAMDVLADNLGKLAEALGEHARSDRDEFGTRAEHLFRPRVGVSYLLPPGASIEQFYGRVRRRMIDDLSASGRLKPNATEADLVNAIIGTEAWREAFKLTWEQSAEYAVSQLRERVKTQVKTMFRDTRPGRAPLLPRLHDLLAEAAAQGTGELSEDDLEEFRGKLAGLVPASFTPQGSGPMKVLVSYPAGARNPALAEYLKESINLPSGPGITFDFRNTAAESISVVLFRSSMGVTEVREVRDVLRTWADALAQPQPQDYLRWRQRTGYNFGYLATREEHRVQILHRILCAMWNGKVQVEGDPVSPAAVTVRLGGGVTMTLPLTPLEEASSWGSLLRAYELWTLTDNEDIRRQFCAQLMTELPADIDTRPAPPHKLYLLLRDLADGQIARIDGMITDLPSGSRSRAEQVRGFWGGTLPAALDLEFVGVHDPVRANLRALEAAVQRWDGER